MKQLIVFFLALNSFIISYAQAPSIQWQKCYGGTSYDEAYTLAKTNDGGFVIAGLTDSNDGDVTWSLYTGALWLIKIDSIGVLHWQKSLGAPLGTEYAYSILQTHDMGYIIAAQASEDGGDVSGMHAGPEDFWIVKTDSVGDIEWQKCLGGSNDDIPAEIQITSDSGYIVIGTTGSGDGDITSYFGGYDAWIVKLDQTGNIQWQENLGGWDHDWGMSIKQTGDGGYVAAIAATSNNGIFNCNHSSQDDFTLVKLDSAGNVTGINCLGGSGEDYLEKIIVCHDGGFLIAGGTYSTDGDVTGLNGPSDSWIVKTDSMGSLIWQKCFGGSSYDWAHSTKQTSDGGFIFVGESTSSDSMPFCNNPGFYQNVWVVKTDSIGNYQWSKCIGGSYNEEGFEIVEADDGGYVIAGYTESNDGDVSGNHIGGANCNPFPCSDFWVVKLAPLGTATTELDYITDFTSYLNPAIGMLSLNFYANGNERLQVQLFDITGRVLLSQALAVSPGFNKQEIYAGVLSDGVYVVRLLTEGGGVTKKLIVQ